MERNGKNGEWNESVHMKRGLIEVNVGYLADKNVCWSCPNSELLSLLPSLRMACDSPLQHVMVRCCAAFSPHSHTTTACTRLLVSHPTPIPHPYFILYGTCWNIDHAYFLCLFYPSTRSSNFLNFIYLFPQNDDK